MGNLNLAKILRKLLVKFAGMNKNQIDNAVKPNQGNNLKQEIVLEKYRSESQRIYINRLMLASKLHSKLIKGGAVWANGVYNINSLNITLDMKKQCIEELSAIKTHSGSQNFNGEKALTNLLRLIYRLENPIMVNVMHMGMGGVNKSKILKF